MYSLLMIEGISGRIEVAVVTHDTRVSSHSPAVKDSGLYVSVTTEVTPKEPQKKQRLTGIRETLAHIVSKTTRTVSPFVDKEDTSPESWVFQGNALRVWVIPISDLPTKFSANFQLPSDALVGKIDFLPT